MTSEEFLKTQGTVWITIEPTDLPGIERAYMLISNPQTVSREEADRLSKKRKRYISGPHVAFVHAEIYYKHAGFHSKRRYTIRFPREERDITHYNLYKARPTKRIMSKTKQKIILDIF